MKKILLTEEVALAENKPDYFQYKKHVEMIHSF